MSTPTISRLRSGRSRSNLPSLERNVLLDELRTKKKSNLDALRSQKNSNKKSVKSSTTKDDRIEPMEEENLETSNRFIPLQNISQTDSGSVTSQHAVPQIEKNN